MSYSGSFRVSGLNESDIEDDNLGENHIYAADKLGIELIYNDGSLSTSSWIFLSNHKVTKQDIEKIFKGYKIESFDIEKDPEIKWTKESLYKTLVSAFKVAFPESKIEEDSSWITITGPMTESFKKLKLKSGEEVRVSFNEKYQTITIYDDLRGGFSPEVKVDDMDGVKLTKTIIEKLREMTTL